MSQAVVYNIENINENFRPSLVENESCNLSEEFFEYHNSSDKNKADIFFRKLLNKNLDINVKDFLRILTEYKIKVSQLDLSFEYEGIKTIDILLDSKNLRLLMNFLLRKPLHNKFVEALKDRPLTLHPIIHEVSSRGYFSDTLVDSITLNIFNIEKNILSHNPNYNISNFLTYLSEQRNFMLSLPCSNGKLKNLEFISNSIPLKNYDENTVLKGKEINNTIFLLGYLFTSKYLKIKSFMYQEDLSILNKFNSQIDSKYILKYLNLNLITFKNNEDTNKINFTKISDLYNSSLLFIELNSHNPTFMINPVVGDLLASLGNQKTFTFLTKLHPDSDHHNKYLQEFEDTRKKMMEIRLQHLLEQNVKTDDSDRVKKKI